MSKLNKDFNEMKPYFFDHINYDRTTMPTNGRTDIGPCLIWTGPVNDTNDYGVIRFSFEGRNLNYVHQFTFVLKHGVQPPRRGEGDASHKCDNKLCCEPEHVRPLSHGDNVREAAETGRMRGKVLTKENVWEALEDMRAGRKTGATARKFKVSGKTISWIRCRRAHKDVGDAFAAKYGYPDSGPIFTGGKKVA